MGTDWMAGGQPSPGVSPPDLRGATTDPGHLLPKGLRRAAPLARSSRSWRIKAPPLDLRASFYRVLHEQGQAYRRDRAKPTQELLAAPRLEANVTNEVWSLDIMYLPTQCSRNLAVPLPGGGCLQS
jgi:hypothetical protein